jgi:hypothetical protein
VATGGRTAVITPNPDRYLRVQSLIESSSMATARKERRDTAGRSDKSAVVDLGPNMHPNSSPVVLWAYQRTPPFPLSVRYEGRRNPP